MSFNKRNFDETSIRRSAKNNTFKEFEKFMVSSDMYICDSGFASIIHDQFIKGSNYERKEIYEQINNDEI
jgi:hypothetical protein